MTADAASQTRSRARSAPGRETAVSGAAAVAAGGAVVAWVACCVLPMTLALAGVGISGLSWIAGLRVWITLLALGAVGLGWVITWRRTLTCRTDQACAAPSRLGTGLLGLATVFVMMALTWQPLIEPWALAMLRGARG